MDGSRDEAGSGVLGLVHGTKRGNFGGKYGHPIETNGGNSTIGNSHCAVAGNLAHLPGASISQTSRIGLRLCHVGPAGVAHTGHRMQSNAGSSACSRATCYNIDTHGHTRVTCFMFMFSRFGL